MVILESGKLTNEILTCENPRASQWIPDTWFYVLVDSDIGGIIQRFEGKETREVWHNNHIQIPVVNDQYTHLKSRRVELLAEMENHKFNRKRRSELEEINAQLSAWPTKVVNQPWKTEEKVDSHWSRLIKVFPLTVDASYTDNEIRRLQLLVSRIDYSKVKWLRVSTRIENVILNRDDMDKAERNLRTFVSNVNKNYKAKPEIFYDFTSSYKMRLKMITYEELLSIRN